jgi:hypothetical protein
MEEHLVQAKSFCMHFHVNIHLIYEAVLIADIFCLTVI